VVSLKDRIAIYYFIFFPVWLLAASIIFLGPPKLLGIPTDQSLPEFPVWLGILLLIVAVVGGMVVAMLITNRIASKFISRDAIIKAINKNILHRSPFYGLIIRDIDKIYKKKDT
jgi:hypothetical protein